MGAAAEPLIERLASAVGAHTSGSASLLSLKGIAEHMQSHAPLPEAHIAAATSYTVEMLDLRVVRK